MSELASSLEALLAAELGPRLTTELAHDPFGAGWLTKFDTDSGGKLRWGRIVDAIPSAGAYRVCLGPQSFLWCSYLGNGFLPHGCKSLSSLPLGSFAVILIFGDTPYWGIVLGVEPTAQLDNYRFRADYIWQGSNTGLLVDSCHRRTLETMYAAGGACNWSAGRPVDQLSTGEWGAVAETGMAVFLDPFLAFLRASEETGFFAFFHDQLARLAGHNLQIRSALGETEDLDDEGEVTRRAGQALYPWENLGVFSYTNPTRSYTGQQVQATAQTYATVEPAYDDQQPFHRVQEFGGYLGQGGRRSLALPPAAPAGPNRFANIAIFPGGWEESVGADGSYAVRSAQSILIAKRPSIPVPKQIRRAEDTSGDSLTSGYNASGGLNSGPMHLVADAPLVTVEISSGTESALSSLAATVTSAGSGSTASAAITATASSIRGEYPDLAGALDRVNQIVLAYPTTVVPHLPALGAVIDRLAAVNPVGTPTQPEPPSNLVRAAALLDASAYAFNWKALHPFFYHPKDWYLPEESALPVSTDLLLPAFLSLSSDQYLPAPTPTELPIDHRYGVGQVYPNEAGLALLPDGGLVLYDGFGGEIRMTGGSVQISCPGDIWMQPGKNLNTYAGWDIVHRAQHSVDITAATTDVRIKADNNIMGLAGNNGCGGILLESKATCPAYNYTDLLGEDVQTTGIVLKAPQAQVVAWGRDVILWGDPQDINGDNPSFGQIILDSGNRVKVYAQYMDRILSQAALDFFVNSSDVVIAANEYWAGATTLDGTLGTTDKAAFGGCVWADGTVTVTNGSFVADQAATYNNLVGTLTGTSLTNANALHTAVRSRIMTVAGSYGPGEQDPTFRDALYDAGTQATFSYRTTDQYRTTGLVLFETRWQQLARLGSAGLPTWGEPEVDAPAGTTYPHPGKDNWTGTPDTGSNPVKAFYWQGLGLLDFTSSDATTADRSSNQAAYETPAYQHPEAQVLEGNYPVIRTS